MTDNCDKFSAQEYQYAETLFREPVSFVLSVADLSQLPLSEISEVAFAGRSNVGKSSIINALFGQKKLAKTSNTPGRTQQLNYFNINNKIHIVDLPGYGYAEAPEKLVKQWQNLIFDYLRGRVNLKRVFVLIDSRHGIKQSDKEIFDLLDKAAVTYQLVLTKTDKITSKELEKQVELLKRIDSKLDGVKKIVVSNIDVYLDDSIDKNSDYRIFKVLKVPCFPMVIDIEKI